MATDVARAEFDGRAVVVTGVGRSGQAGEVVARAFGAQGAVVHCVDRGDRVHDRVHELRALGINAVGHVADLADVAAVSELAGRISSLHGGAVAAVAALAGGFDESGPIGGSDPDVFARQIAINLTSAYATARAFVPSVRVARGAFVFVTSAAVLPGGKVTGLSAYAMAKGALIQLMRSIAQEEKAHGVRANAVAPTAIRTAANVDAMGEGVRYVEREEFAGTIVALCGHAFSRVTGQVFELA
jgi:3-oxoacyl-[acyl-carrier protein] reductase